MFGHISSDGLWRCAQKLVQQKHLESLSLDRPTVNIQPSDDHQFLFTSHCMCCLFLPYFGRLWRAPSLKPCPDFQLSDHSSLALWIHPSQCSWSGPKRFRIRISSEYHRIMNNIDLIYIISNKLSMVRSCAKKDNVNYNSTLLNKLQDSCL